MSNDFSASMLFPTLIRQEFRTHFNLLSVACAGNYGSFPVNGNAEE